MPKLFTVKNFKLSADVTVYENTSFTYQRIEISNIDGEISISYLSEEFTPYIIL